MLPTQIVVLQTPTIDNAVDTSVPTMEAQCRGMKTMKSLGSVS